jgi:hypothetical protein
MTCLAKRPCDRYPSAAALADALEALPPAGDWGKSDAELWWDQFRTTRNSSLVAGLPTLTVTVDLDRRT